MKQYEELTFTDDFMFCRIMQYNEDICKDLVELIIGKKIGGIVRNDRQHPIEITADGRGVRMDVYLEDDSNTVYNIEMQNGHFRDLGRRARYYQSMIDVDMFERGCTYDQLKDSYVIFISIIDPFKQNYPIYTIKNKCLEDEHVEYEDGTTKVFVNASGCGKMNQEMKAFLEYLNSGNAGSNLTHRIDEKILEAKRNSGWKGDFMTLYEHYQIERAEGLAEGLDKGLTQARTQAVEALMETMQLSLEQACEALKLSVEDYQAAKQ